jgi:hypothetical protein
MAGRENRDAAYALLDLIAEIRQRERGLQRFKSLRHAARFCSVFSTVCNQFRPAAMRSQHPSIAR